MTSAGRVGSRIGAGNAFLDGPSQEVLHAQTPDPPLDSRAVTLGLQRSGRPSFRAGHLAVSTSTSGDDPDPDGFQLTVDGIDSLALLPSGTAELDLSPGRHTLQLLGVADHCLVVPGTSVEVDITAGRTAPVTFQVSCPGTTIRVTVTTTGLDPDQDGYQLTIDGVDALALVPTGTAQMNVAPGRHTLQLQGVADHCSVYPGTSLEVEITRGSTTPVAFAINCPLTGAPALRPLRPVFPVLASQWRQPGWTSTEGTWSWWMVPALAVACKRFLRTPRP